MMMFTKNIRNSFSLLFVALLAVGCNSNSSTSAYVDNIEEARNLLEEQRSEALQKLQQEITAEPLEKLVALGSWEEAQSYLNEVDTPTSAMKLVQAQLWMKQNHYDDAETLVNAVLDDEPENHKGLVLRAKLFIQAWNLTAADSLGQLLLEENSSDAMGGWLRGRVALLQRDYDGALEWAQKTQEWDSEFAAGYRLEAQSRFWAQDPEGAESALVEALKRDPFNADARFSYGYAIWRRVDATQLDAMAAQWNLALEINPLHYLTHWHFGNGHTNLTYADYAEPSDSAVQAQLAEGDALVAQNKPNEAIALTRKAGEQYPESILPAMMRGSIFYMHYEMDRAARLDSAGKIFRSILQEKQNYGPAHNGLAAVIKQRQFSYLDGFEELEQAIANTEVPDKDVFYEVFPDLNYYPGDRVGKMVSQQIGPSRAYLPMINMLGRDFQLPPLHHDLAEAMGRISFLYNTTFDNRQWMDIRGVGSGAAGIEYIERGSHWERNVLAHEYAHLYHGRILTDKESRRIRSLYHAAMRNDRALDYYAANNESEFFAQGYAGFLSEKKVHPLTHKSMNTNTYIRERDPAFYAFLDSLIQKQKAYLAGNEEIFDSNWAQTYLSLAQRSDDQPQEAIDYLETALEYDPNYLPALLAYSEIEAEQGRFDQAGQWIEKAQTLNPDYAPTYVSRAYILHQQALQGTIDFDTSIKEQAPLFDRALQLERDLGVRADINQTYRRRNLQYGRLAEAIEVAKQYADDAPEISTYLRDQKEETQAFIKWLNSSIGYSTEAIDFFDDLVAQNPQEFSLRLMYADVLTDAGRPDEALSVLQEGHRILAAAGDNRPEYTLQIARLYLMKNEADSSQKWVDRLDSDDLNLSQREQLAILVAQLGDTEKASAVLPSLEGAVVPAQKAEWYYADALIKEKQNSNAEAIESYQAVLQWNPYHVKARRALINLLEASGKTESADKVKQEIENLPIPFGPGIQW